MSYILFDPITCERRNIDYETLIKITGMNKVNLSSYKSRKRKIKSINCYFLDASISFKELKKLMKKEKLDDEIFLDIPGTNGLYQASNYGRIKTNNIKYKGDFLMLYKRNDKNKYKKWLMTHVKIHGKVKEMQVHRLVAMAFLGVKSSDKIVVHKNGLLCDNRICNLEYIDRKETGKRYAYLSRAMPVAKLDLETKEVIEEYPSMAEAGRKNFLHKESIRDAFKRGTNYSGGFKWEIIDEL